MKGLNHGCFPQHRPKPREFILQVDPCCFSFDYPLSNNCLKHIYCGSIEARSALMLTHFHKITNNHAPQFLSGSTFWHFHPHSRSSNRRTLSLGPRGKRPEIRLSSPFTFKNQEDCGSIRWHFHLYASQFFPGLSITQNIKIKSGVGLWSEDTKSSSIHPFHASVSGINKAEPVKKRALLEKQTKLRSFV